MKVSSKLLQQKPKFVQIFASIGDSWSVSEELLDELKESTCFLYGRQRFKRVDEVRHLMLREKCEQDAINVDVNIDLASMPPCRRSLKQHERRSNFQEGIWRRALEPVPDIPDPTAGHGWMKDEGILVPLWTEEEDELRQSLMIFSVTFKRKRIRTSLTWNICCKTGWKIHLTLILMMTDSNCDSDADCVCDLDTLRTDASRDYVC